MTTPTFSITNIRYVVDIILVQPSLISGLDKAQKSHVMFPQLDSAGVIAM